MSFATDPELRASFLAAPRVAVLSINQADRGPLSVPVWYWCQDNGDLWFETETDSYKARFLAVGSRVTLCVQDEQPPYAYLAIEGPIIEIAEDDVERHQVPMAQRYLGEREGREYIDNLPPLDWKRYIIRPERFSGFDGVADE